MTKANDLSAAIKRGLVFVTLFCIVLATALGCTLAALDLDSWAALYVALATTIGGGLFFLGLLRYVPLGPFMPSLLAMSLIAAFGLVLYGVGFDLRALSEALSPGSVINRPGALVIIMWGCFSAAATSKLAVGLFVFFEVYPLDADVRKVFWRKHD